MNTHQAAEAGSPPLIDPQTLVEDPHAALTRLRDAHALVMLGERHYMALRAQDVAAIMSDPRIRQIEGEDYVRIGKIPEGVASRLLTDFFLFKNDEAHRARRGLFARGFAHGPVRQSQTRIRAVADRIVADLPRGESFDFVERVAGRLPAEMIAAMLGLPLSEVPFFAARVSTVARAVLPVYPLDDHDRIETAAFELCAYVEDHLLSRLDQPRVDLLSRIVTDWSAKRELTFESLVNQVVGMIIGGTDTTRAGFAMLVAHLLRHPDAWEAVKADPALIPGAVAEGLRFDPSVGSIARFTATEVEIAGTAIPAGSLVRVSTLSAMRDPALYAHPDRFDIRRTDHPRLHVAFGEGPHRCIGEMLARIEMQQGLAALIAGAPDLILETTPHLVGFGGIRQITAMRTRLPAGPRPAVATGLETPMDGGDEA